MRLGPYEIVAPIGSGGMGCVYRARDPRLGRALAIKVLGARQNGDAVVRLRREAEAASSLNHPAIVTIYDIGEASGAGVFVAMELIDGCNLREWLRSNPPQAKRIDVIRQVASGLAVAHAHGIVHRDIKPENIMVSNSGFAKIVDFGLAKAVGQSVADSAETDVRLTASGHVVGTFAYMSPEQRAGEPLDARSDIYSVGCVLRDVFGADDPTFSPIIERCLEKDRSRRYQTMDALIADMERPRRRRFTLIASAAAVLVIVVAGIVMLMRRSPSPQVSGGVHEASIAVLSFRMLGGNADSYVADGLTDSLTTDLGKHSGLTVIDRNASRRYSPEDDVRKAGEELHVRHVLLGSVQRVGETLRIDARLVDPATQTLIWSDHYDRPLSQIFSAEGEIVRAVSSKVAPRTAGRPVTQPLDPRVADLYLRARFFLEDPNWNVQAKAIPLLEEVLRLDPAFLPARVELAGQYQQNAFERDPDRTWEQKSFVEVQKILLQDPSSGTAYTIRGNLRWTVAHGFAHEEALADFNRAIHLDPNNIRAYRARGGVLTHVGLFDQALNDFQHALHLDPFDDFSLYRVARIHLMQQKCVQAAGELQRRWPGDFQLPIALDCAGDQNGALRVALQSAALNPAESRIDPRANTADQFSALAVLYAKRGDRSNAEEAIRKAKAGEGGSHFHHAMYYIAAAYAQMRDADSALHWLERTAREGMPCYPLFASDPLLNPIRSDLRMQRFLDAQRRDWEERRRQNPS